jgi:hypothetical protein
MTAEELSDSKKFNDLLIDFSRKKRLWGFDDYKQAVLLNILETGEVTFYKAVKIADKIAARVKRDQQREYACEYHENDAVEEPRSVLWEDRHILK